MVNIRVAINIGEARSILKELETLAESPRPLMAAAGAILENSIRDRFATSSGPGGAKWLPSGRQRQAALPGTGKRGKPTRKDRRNPMGPNDGGRTLVDKGGLLSSITHVADARRVEVGIIAKTPSAKWAHVHQFGATIVPKRAPFLVFTGADGHKVFAKKVVIPARPFIGIDQQDRTDLLQAWRDYLRTIK